VQGLVTGPYAFIAYSSDCKVLGILNFLTYDYADDFNLLVPENSDVPVKDKMKQIISWSKSNKLSINLAKCKEMVFWRPGLKSEFMSSLLPDVVSVTCCKLLGTFVDCNLNFSHQVDQVVKVCSQIYYLLQQMRKQGLDKLMLVVCKLFCSPLSLVRCFASMGRLC